MDQTPKFVEDRDIYAKKEYGGCFLSAAHALGEYRAITYHRRPAHWHVGEHSHSWWQILIVTDGSVYLSAGGAVVHLTRGMVSIVPPGVSHSLWTEEPYTQFGPELLADETNVTASYLAEHVSEPIVLDYHRGLAECEEAAMLVKRPDRISRAMLCAQTNVIVLRLLQEMVRINSHRENEYQNTLEEILRENLMNPLPLASIAARMHLSRSQCERLCLKHYGCGIMTLYRQMRINRACELLALTAQPVSSIAAQMGFADVSGFSKFFKKETGYSPSAYRERG